jgi:hypothetical protein
MLVWLFGFVARPLFLPRVILYCVPGLILLIAAVCFAFERRVAARVGMAVVLIYGGSTLLFGTMRKKEDWRGANDYLAVSVAPTDVIAVCPIYTYPTLALSCGRPSCFSGTCNSNKSRKTATAAKRGRPWHEPRLGQEVFPL